MKHSFTVTYAVFSPRRFGRTRARLAPRRCASPPRCWSPMAPSQRRSWRLDSWRSEDRSNGTCWNWLEHLLDTDLLHSVTWLVVWNMNLYFPVNIGFLIIPIDFRWFGTSIFYFPINIGFVSSSQLTNSYFSNQLLICGGFHGHGGTPNKLDGLVQGKFHLQMDDDWG